MLFPFFLCFIHPITSSQDPRIQQIFSNLEHSFLTFDAAKTEILEEIKNEIEDENANMEKEKENMANSFQEWKLKLAENIGKEFEDWKLKQESEKEKFKNKYHDEIKDEKANMVKEKENMANSFQEWKLKLASEQENIGKEFEDWKLEQKSEKENIKKETLENEVQGLQDMKDEKIQKVCLEEHTLIRYVSNNYGQIFLAIVTIILSCIVVRFIFRQKISQNPKCKYETIITIIKHHDEMSISEDADEDERGRGLTVNNPLDRTRTNKYQHEPEPMNINMNFTQTHDIENEEPEQYLDHMKDVYEIQENLGERWKEMEPGQRLNLNLWKVLSGTIQLTKLSMVKIKRNNKYLLTFQLFNNKFNLNGFQGISHEEIDEGLINQLLIFYNKLPSFTV